MLFIAEIGMNHNGNFDLAGELIRQAAWAGANIAKFQIGWRCNEGEINVITPEILKKIEKWCDHFGIEFMASVITPAAYEMYKTTGAKRVKVASRTLKEKQFFDTIVKEQLGKKQIIASVGMWEESTLPYSPKDITYLWCKSMYPTAPWDLKDFPKEFSTNQYTGYSDHCLGIEQCLIATSRGATIIEKHFTLDKSDTHIRDHLLSATPDEFKQMVTLGKGIERNLKSMP